MSARSIRVQVRQGQAGGSASGPVLSQPRHTGHQPEPSITGRCSSSTARRAGQWRRRGPGPPRRPRRRGGLPPAPRARPEIPAADHPETPERRCADPSFSRVQARYPRGESFSARPVCWVSDDRRSAEAAGDVVLGGLLLRGGKEFGGVGVLDQLAGLTGPGEVEKRGAVGDPGGLLHVVGDDDDGVTGLQVVDESRAPRNGARGPAAPPSVYEVTRTPLRPAGPSGTQRASHRPGRSRPGRPLSGRAGAGG